MGEVCHETESNMHYDQRILVLLCILIMKSCLLEPSVTLCRKWRAGMAYQLVRHLRCISAQALVVEV
jgi:hypothetical protein